jgi:hypothetical protein
MHSFPSIVHDLSVPTKRPHGLSPTQRKEARTLNTPEFPPCVFVVFSCGQGTRGLESPCVARASRNCPWRCHVPHLPGRAVINGRYCSRRVALLVRPRLLAVSASSPPKAAHRRCPASAPARSKVIHPPCRRTASVASRDPLQRSRFAGAWLALGQDDPQLVLHDGAGCPYNSGSYHPLIAPMGGRKALAVAVRASA